MNKTALCLALGLVSGGSFASECRSVAEYTVKPVSFSRTSVGEAVKKVAAGLPLTVKVSPSANSADLAAEDVSGRLDLVLNDLTASTYNKWSQHGCAVVITAGEKPPAPVVADAAPSVPVWLVRKGDSLDKVIRRWAEPLGWQVIWHIEELDTLLLMADAQYQGTLEEAVEDLAESLAASGEALRFVFNRGNKALRISRTE